MLSSISFIDVSGCEDITAIQTLVNDEIASKEELGLQCAAVDFSIYSLSGGPKLYARLTFSVPQTFTPPSDPTDELVTVPGTFVDVTKTGLASSIDPGSVSDLQYRRIHVPGAAAYVPLLVIPGLGQAYTAIPQSKLERVASYQHPVTGYRFLAIAPSTRGRVVTSPPDNGGIDCVRDSYDLVDILDDAVSSSGVTAFGSGKSAVLWGHSTGAHGAMLFARRFRDRTLGIIGMWLNFDLLDPEDGYFSIVNDTVRSQSLDVWFYGSLKTRDPAIVDFYRAADPIDGWGEWLAEPGAPEIWIIADDEDPATVRLPNHRRLIQACLSRPEGIPKTHIHISSSSDPDDDRTRHDDVHLSTGNIRSERYWVMRMLDPTENVLPRSGRQRILGFIEMRAVTSGSDIRPGLSIWLGDSKRAKFSPTGGQGFSAWVDYDDSATTYRIAPITGKSGWVHIIRGREDRSVDLDALSLISSTDYTMQNTETTLFAIPSNNTSTFNVTEGQSGINGLRVLQIRVPDGWPGGDAICTFVDRDNRSASRRIVCTGLGAGEHVVKADFVFRTATITNSQSGGNGSLSLSVELRSVVITGDAPAVAIYGAWSAGIGEQEIVSENLQEGWAELAGPLTDEVSVEWRKNPASSGIVTHIDLAMAITLSEPGDAGFNRFWSADHGVTGSSPVTAWSEVGGYGDSSFSSPSSGPTLGTDSDGVQFIGFDSANSQKMVLSSLLVDPTRDFTVGFVFSMTSATDSFPFEISHHGSLARLTIRFTGTSVDLIYFDNSGNISATCGGLTLGTGVKALVIIMRSGSEFYLSVNGSLWRIATKTNDTFTTSGSNTTSLGCGWADPGPIYWKFSPVRFYAVFSRQVASSEAAVLSAMYAYAVKQYVL